MKEEKHLFIKGSDVEVKKGDDAIFYFGTGNSCYSNNNLDDKIINALVSAGILEERRVYTITVDDIYDHIADTIDESKSYIKKVLDTLKKYSKASVFNIMLEDLSAMYEELHFGERIEEYNTLYWISKVDGSIKHCYAIELGKGRNNIAFFRSEEELKEALEVLKDLYNEIYGKQKN